MPKSRKNPRRKVNRTPQPSNHKKANINGKPVIIKMKMPINGEVFEMDQEIYQFNSCEDLILINDDNPMDLKRIKIDVTIFYDIEVLDENSLFGKHNFPSDITWTYNGMWENGSVNYVGGIFKNGDLERIFSSHCYQIEGMVCFDIIEHLGYNKYKMILSNRFKHPKNISNDNMISLAKHYLFGSVHS